MGVEQHFVLLAWLRHQPERAAGAQFHVRHLWLPVDASDAPLPRSSGLEGVAHFKLQRHKGLGRLALLSAPLPNELRHK